MISLAGPSMVSGTYGNGQRIRTTLAVSVPSGCFATTVNGSDRGGSARYSWTVYRISAGHETFGPDASRPRATSVTRPAVFAASSFVKLRHPPVTTVALTTTAVFGGASVGTSSSLIPRMTLRLVPSGSRQPARRQAATAANRRRTLTPMHTRGIAGKSPQLLQRTTDLPMMPERVENPAESPSIVIRDRDHDLRARALGTRTHLGGICRQQQHPNRAST